MNKLTSTCLYAVIALMFTAPLRAGAQNTCSEGGVPVVCNPLTVDTISEFLSRLVDIITTLAVPVIVIMIIYAGFLFVTAGGNSEQIDDAKETAMYVAIGAAVILGAQVITDVLINTAQNLGVEGLEGGTQNN